MVALLTLIGGLKGRRRVKSSFAFFALAALFMPAAFAQPRISKVQNVFSLILPGMPNSGIAQGSVFAISGTGLATTTSAPQVFPLQTVLEGASVDVTVNATTTHAILYFVSATQIVAILPSATPTGSGQVKVAVGGKTSSAGITVVQSAFGMLSLNAVGNGPAAVFDVNWQYLGLTNAANPGDVISLWGTGVGPITGDETNIQTPQNLTDVPIEVDIGGVPATVQYAGRGYYPGLDVIRVQVPSGVSGCKVSVVVRSGDIVSNFGTIPVASSGRTCSEPVVGLSASRIQTLLSQPVINRGVINFSSDSAGSSADVTFSRFTSAQYATKQPFASPVSLGDCTVFNFTNQNMAVPNPPAFRPVPLDAGPSISLMATSESSVGNASMPFQDGGYSAPSLPAANSFKGTYTFTGTGGPDIGVFSAQLTLPGGGSSYTTSTLNNVTSVTRSQGLTVTWTQPKNSDADLMFIQISGYAFAPNFPYGADFACNVPLAAGRFTIPPAVLLALPPQGASATPLGELEIDLIITRQFTAPGVDVGTFNWVWPNPFTFNYQ